MKKNKIKKQGSMSQENSWHAALLFYCYAYQLLVQWTNFDWENNGQISERNISLYKNMCS